MLYHKFVDVRVTYGGDSRTGGASGPLMLGGIVCVEHWPYSPEVEESVMFSAAGCALWARY